MLKLFFYIALFIFLVVFIYDLLTKKYTQPYQLNIVMGAPGTGKSTMYCKLAYRYLSRGYHVYGTDPITVYIKEKHKREKTPVQVKKIEVRNLFRYSFPPDSIILIDEIGSVLNNRQWKSLSQNNVSFWKRYRHDRLIIWGWSQAWDMDLTVRNLVSQFWLCERYLRCWSVCRRLIRKPVVVHPVGDAPSSIQDDFVEDPKLLRPVMGGMMITFIPHWVKCFDSFEIPDDMLKLRDIDYSADPVPYEPRKIYHRRIDKLHMFLERVKIGLCVLFLKLKK